MAHRDGPSDTRPVVAEKGAKAEQLKKERKPGIRGGGRVVAASTNSLADEEAFRCVKEEHFLRRGRGL